MNEADSLGKNSQLESAVSLLNINLFAFWLHKIYGARSYIAGSEKKRRNKCNFSDSAKSQLQGLYNFNPLK